MITEQIKFELANKYYICPDCGCLVAECDLITVNNEIVYYCSKCILDHAFKCLECGEWTDIDQLRHDENNDKIEYCEECRLEYYSYCEDCDNYVNNDDINFVESSGTYVCNDCLDNNFVRCDHCREYYRTNSRHIWASDTNQTICQNCCENYFVCDCCDEIYHMDNYGDDNRCQDCRDNDNHSSYIHDYSYKPDPLFFGVETITDIFKGFELEIDNISNKHDLAEELSKFKEIYLKNDGSLSDNGVEIVSHPMTLKYIKESFKLNDILNICKKYDARSHEAGNCGLHIHLNRDYFKNYELSATKILYLFEKFWPEIEKFSRRKDFGYCHKNRFNTEQDIKPNEIRKVREKTVKMDDIKPSIYVH